ncbi:MAG: LrgB family protein, partial [Albidovulum sp.]
MTDLTAFWSYLSEGPLLWLALTLLAYAAGDACFRASGRKPYVNTVLVAVAILAMILWVTGTSYGTYFEGAQFVHFLLGPATVSLALPLFDNLGR